MPKSLNRVFIHAVWSTREREPILHSSFRTGLHGEIERVADEFPYHMLIANSVEDHVHCLFQLPTIATIAGIMKSIKGTTSTWIFQNQLVEGAFNWQRGYSAFSVSPQNVARVRSYIYNQEQHHRSQTFEDELKMLEREAD